MTATVEELVSELREVKRRLEHTETRVSRLEGHLL